MNEQLANLGYLAIRKETTPGTVAGIPNVFLPIYSETLATDGQYVEDSPIMASKFFRYQVLRGLRKHTGGFVCKAEPNTVAYVADMLYTKGTTTGSDPYTHPYTLSGATKPNFYTVEIGLANMAVRFIGFGASDVTPEYEEGVARFNINGAALKAFTTRTVSSVTGSGPYVIALTTDYSTKPTEGLYTGDAIQVYDISASAYLTATVSSLTDTTITVSQNVSAGASGDILTLRPQTPSWSLREDFHWARTEFRFGATAAAALTATHTPLEQDTSVKLIHEFANDAEHRSGSHDPASLIRTKGDVEFTVKQYFDTPEAMKRWQAIDKLACVIRMFSETNLEFRITLNNLKAASDPRPQLSSTEVLYSETKYLPTPDVSDGQAFDIKVINKVATI